MGRSIVFALGTVALVFTLSCTGETETGGAPCPGELCKDCEEGCMSIELMCEVGEVSTCVGLEVFGGDNPLELSCQYCAVDTGDTGDTGL